MESNNKLTKAEIIDGIYEELDIDRSDIHKVIDKLFEHLKDALSDDQLKLLLKTAEEELTSFRKSRGTVAFPTSAHIVTARK